MSPIFRGPKISERGRDLPPPLWGVPRFRVGGSFYQYSLSMDFSCKPLMSHSADFPTTAVSKIIQTGDAQLYSPLFLIASPTDFSLRRCALQAKPFPRSGLRYGKGVRCRRPQSPLKPGSAMGFAFQTSSRVFFRPLAKPHVNNFLLWVLSFFAPFQQPPWGKLSFWVHFGRANFPHLFSGVFICCS